jgi:hypothetical protein
MNFSIRLHPRLLLTLTVALLALLGFFLAQSPIAQAAMQNVALFAEPAIPLTFNYQGYMRNADGTLATGVYTITATIYDDPFAGSNKHSETFANVNVRDGLFNIVLGSQIAMNASTFDAAPRYIGISINGEAEVFPRERVHGVPWAIHASNAALATNATNATNASVATSLSTIRKTTYVDTNATFAAYTIDNFFPSANDAQGACFLVEVKIEKVFANDLVPIPDAAGCSITNDDLRVGPQTTCRVTCIDLSQ